MIGLSTNVCLFSKKVKSYPQLSTDKSMHKLFSGRFGNALLPRYGYLERRYLVFSEVCVFHI